MVLKLFYILFIQINYRLLNMFGLALVTTNSFRTH